MASTTSASFVITAPSQPFATAFRNRAFARHFQVVIGMSRGGACSSRCDKLNRRSLWKGSSFRERGCRSDGASAKTEDLTAYVPWPFSHCPKQHISSSVRRYKQRGTDCVQTVESAEQTKQTLCGRPLPANSGQSVSANTHGVIERGQFGLSMRLRGLLFQTRSSISCRCGSMMRSRSLAKSRDMRGERGRRRDGAGRVADGHFQRRCRNSSRACADFPSQRPALLYGGRRSSSSRRAAFRSEAAGSLRQVATVAQASNVHTPCRGPVSPETTSDQFWRESAVSGVRSVEFGRTIGTSGRRQSRPPPLRRA